MIEILNLYAFFFGCFLLFHILFHANMDADFILNLLYLYLIIGSGFLIFKISGKHKEDAKKILTDLMIHVITPILLSINLLTSKIMLTARFVFKIVALEVFALVFIMFGAYLIFKNKILEKPKLGAFIKVASMPNALLFPLPIVLLMFGSKYVIVLTIFSASAVVMRGTLVIFVALKFGDNKNGNAKSSEGIQPRLKEIVINLVKFTPLMAIIITLIIMSFGVKIDSISVSTFKFFMSWISTIGGALVIGAILTDIRLKEMDKDKSILVYAIFIRFVFSVCIFLLIEPLIHFDSENTIIKTILLLEFGSPPAVFNVIFAVKYKLDEKFTAVCVTIMSLLALVFIPIYLQFGMFYFN
mgnify:CR=1 FL=1